MDCKERALARVGSSLLGFKQVLESRRPKRGLAEGLAVGERGLDPYVTHSLCWPETGLQAASAAPLAPGLHCETDWKQLVPVRAAQPCSMALWA